MAGAENAMNIESTSFITTVSSVKREIVQNEIIRAKKGNGDKIPSVRVLAKKYRVSPTTIMRIVAELTGEGVLITSEKRGVFINAIDLCSRYLIPKDNIAVIVNAFGYYYDEVLGVIEAEADKRNLRIIFQTSGWGYRDVSPIIAELGGLSRTAGIIMRIPDGFSDTTPFMHTISQGVPIVFIDSDLAEVNTDSITVDNITGARRAVEHLIENGHTRIGFFREPTQVRSSVEADRYRGYCAALAAHGITAPNEFDIQRSEDDLSLADASLRDLIASQTITAFFCYNDLYAHWLIAYCRMQNISVPDDISIVGFDNARSLPTPRLSTMDPHKEVMGLHAARLLFRRIASPYDAYAPEHIVLTPTLVHGDTVRSLSGVR